MIMLDLIQPTALCGGGWLWIFLREGVLFPQRRGEISFDV